VMLPAFRRHIRAVFESSIDSVPDWMFRQQETLERQIYDIGLRDKLALSLRGLANARQRAEEPFEVFIVGEGSHGKSTLINALLGKRIAEVGWQPVTWCFNRYISTDSPIPYIRFFIDGNLEYYPHLSEILATPVGEFRGLREYHVPPDDANEIIKGEERRTNEGQSAGQPYVSPIMEIEWQLSHGHAALPGLRLVDTMGMGHFLRFGHAHKHHLSWQYERADAVIWVVSQDAIGAKETRQQLMHCLRYSKPVIMILNKWDRIQGNPTPILNRAIEEYGQFFRDIIPFSAEAAFLSTQPEGYQYSRADHRHLQVAKVNDWNDLRAPSGMESLLSAFNRLADRKFQAIRNIQIYSSLRQRQFEARRVFSSARDEAKANLQKYYLLKSKIESARRDGMEAIEQRITRQEASTMQSIDSKIVRVNCKNRKSAQGILQLEQLALEMRNLIRELAKQSTQANVQIIRIAHSRDNEFTDSEYDSTGGVGSTTFLAGVGDVSVEIADDGPDWSIPTGWFWDDVKVWWWEQTGNTQAIETFTREIRDNIRSECRRSITSYLSSTKGRLKRVLEQKNDQLRTELDRNIQYLGGVAILEALVGNVDRTIQEVAVPCAFINMTVRALRKYKWPKAAL